MTTSTNGIVCFGVKLDAGYALPWRTKAYMNSIRAWWLAVWGYQPSTFFNERGEYIDGVRPPDDVINQYYQARQQIFQDHPLSVALINYGIREQPAYILAIPKTVIQAHRGYPAALPLSQLVVSPADWAALTDFVRTYCAIADPKARWYLANCWAD